MTIKKSKYLVLCLSITGYILLVFISIVIQRNQLMEQFGERGVLIAKNISEASVESIINDKPYALIDVLNNYKDEKSVKNIEIFDMQGQQIVSLLSDTKKFSEYGFKNIPSEIVINDLDDVFVINSPILKGIKGIVRLTLSKQDINQSIILAIIIEAGFGLLLVLIFSYILGRAINKYIIFPIDDAIINIKKITSNRDISCEINFNSTDKNNELGNLISSFNEFIRDLRSVLKELILMSDDLNEQFEKLFEVSCDMRNESQEQASMIEETTAANEELLASVEGISLSAEDQAKSMSGAGVIMLQLAQTTKDISKRAIDVKESTDNAAVDFSDITDKLNSTMKSMEEMKNNSKSILDVVTIINNIAEQINMLSLNATIEAARAGDSGRGFAVVAGEISKLAALTNANVGEIESMIKLRHIEIENGVKAVSQTANSVSTMIEGLEKAKSFLDEVACLSEQQISSSEQVMTDVQSVNAMADEIARATCEQKTTSNEILTAISGINESIQVVSSTANMLSEFSGNVMDKSKKMKKLVNNFTVIKESTAAVIEVESGTELSISKLNADKMTKIDNHSSISFNNTVIHVFE